MKKLFSLVVIVLACKAAAWAQPSLLIPTAAPNAGQSFCVDVKVKDFTDILSMDFSLQWDPQIIQFERVEGFGLPNFGAGNFNTTQAPDGSLSVSWLVAQCSPTAVGVTTPDGTTIFRLCFKALGQYGESSEIVLNTNQPIRVTRVNACPNNIGMFSKNGLVSVGVRPLTLIASQETAAKTGDLVCVDYKVVGFDNLTSMQFSVQWDPAILDFVNVQGLENLVNLAPSSFGTPDMASVGPGKLTVSWSYVDPADPGVDLPDSTTIFQACFRAIGACEKSTSIDFVDSPTPFEFTNTVKEGFELKVVTESGKVSVGPCDPPGLKLFADCGAPANPNAEVCVKISTAGFSQVREFAYNLQWDENILEYVGVRNVNGAIAGFDFPGDFNIANVSNGVLGVNWSTNNTLGVSLPGGAGNMFEVCFKVIGVEGGSPVTFTGPSKVVTFNNPNLGIAPSNCAVEVIKPQGVVMTLTDTQAPLGDTACVKVSVANFNNITSYQFSLAWEPNHMTFADIKNNTVNLPEGSIANFGLLGVDGGALTFEWKPSKEYSVPDNTVIFEACFVTTGNPQDCDLLQVVDDPLEAEAINTTSNGNNIGIVSQPADVCIVFPEGFFLDIAAVTGDTASVVCVPVKVSSFDNIISAQFPISWEPSALEFVGVQNPNTLPGLSDASFDITSTGVGLLKVNWTNGGGPVNVPDSTTIFELCFTLVGSPDDCYEIREGEPDPIVNTANGGGSLLSDPGEVCIRGRVILQDTIIKAVSCPGTDDGEINLGVIGGRGALGYNGGTVPQRFGPTARNLSAGMIAVTVFDNSNPALILKDTFEIPINTNLPTANAGEDKDFTCNPPLVQLQGQGSSGTGFSYLWRTADGRLSPNVTSLNAAALAPGAYILEVTNDETGCVARDTVNIVASSFPTANAGEDRNFSCSLGGVGLSGTGSSTGENIRYKWTAFAGGTIEAGQDTVLSSKALTPGTYVLAVSNTATGCMTADTVLIREIAFPNANAGEDVELPCGEGASVELTSRSSNTDQVRTQWLDLNGQVLADSLQLIARATGTYVLQVINPANNCTALDTVQVKPSSVSPVIALDSLKQLTCLTDTLTLNANVSNSSNFVFTWTAQNGGQFITGTQTSLTPKIALPGTYQIEVRDTTTRCVTTNSVIVEEDKTTPTVEAGTATALSCQETERELDGTGSSTGADFTSAWKLGNTTVASDTLKTKVTTPGLYLLEITNKTNGCVAVDSVRLDANIDQPQVIVPIEEQRLNCRDSVLSITASTNIPNFTVEWTTSNGNIVNGQTNATVTANKAGTYVVKVINTENGCSGTGDVVVIEDKNKPNSDAGEAQKITCATTSVTLNGNNSSVGSDFTYQWRAVTGGQNPSPNNAPQVSVSVPGTYELVVTNTVNNCVSVDQVIVTKNDTLPQLRLAAVDSITCRDTIATLDATATRPTNISIQWNSLGGGVPRQTSNPLIFEVTQGGDYEVLITNPDNGCVAKDTITVQASKDIPQLNITSAAPLTCTQPSTILNAGSSTINGAFTAQWTTVMGGTVQANATNPLQATANGAGTYRLSVVVNQTGCSASAEVVLANPEFPMASAAADKPTIGCGETATLSSAGSTSGIGINYRWAVLSGTGTIANPAAQNVQVDKAGNYQLIVTNANNGCSDTAQVAIMFNIQFERANAGADKSVCEPTTMLTANLPMGTTGQWRTVSGAAVPNGNQASVSVSNLQTGDNRFVWALSAQGCGEYSADTVAVKVESAPTTADDSFTLKAGETQGTILVTSNDNVSSIGAFTVSVTRNPVLGGIGAASPDGRIGYLVKAGVFGEDEFAYKLCSNTCPSLCDSATVSVFIEEDPDFEAPPRVNAITPNGDGLNEQLVFDELRINPDQYPDNELIVFNRWGDVVYTARPYANNWDGTNDTGQNLPEGTYYYILRLNISEGVIIRGDVTIVR
ncbi:MAG: gliding motility-associated C-terminal domain-containing protein [Saprospiraceae bacterium]